MLRRFRWLIAIITSVAVLALTVASPASASPAARSTASAVAKSTAAAAAPSTAVSSVPAAWTPQVTSGDATVRELVPCGSTVYAVGSFSQVKQGGTTFARKNAFSFSATTGVLTSWNPNVNGEVNTVALNAGCSTAYLGGTFTIIGATTVRNIAAVSPTTGAVVTSFAHSASGGVNTILSVNSDHDLMVGGAFTSINGGAKAYEASLDPVTGKVNNYFTVVVAGKLPGNSGATKSYNSQLGQLGDRMLVEGNFTTWDGQPRLQLAELDLGATSATLDPFSNEELNTTYCAGDEEFFGRAANLSPDEQTIYLATTGYRGSSPFCDAVTAFSNAPGGAVVWSNLTGCDSLYAVAASSTDVYIGGHERWANNPLGCDSPGSGYVDRPGIADIGSTSGLATSWNPTRARGHGADDLTLTSGGLWVASDTFFNSVKCGGVYHPGICFFPSTPGTTPVQSKYALAR